MQLVPARSNTASAAHKEGQDGRQANDAWKAPEPTVDLSELPTDDAVGLYLKEGACVPLLSAEQERS